jgi:hypothetical protein
MLIEYIHASEGEGTLFYSLLTYLANGDEVLSRLKVTIPGGGVQRRGHRVR